MTEPEPQPQPGLGPLAAGKRIPRRNLYLESRYRKLERGLPQTIFYCPDCKGDRRRRQGCARCAGAGKLTRDSVQELIGRVLLPAYRARTGKFHGAGREDVDVLMLGSGRPFVYEVVGPRNFAIDLEDLRARVHELAQGRIEIDPFEPVPRARVAYWKEGRFAKVYRAEVTCTGEPDLAALQAAVGKPIAILQRTPERVAHRRADLEREREVTVLRAASASTGQLQLDLRCAHGTYVKEWISGEEGRTQPALPAIAKAPCRCETLDVLEILTGE